MRQKTKGNSDFPDWYQVQFLVHAPFIGASLLHIFKFHNHADLLSIDVTEDCYLVQFLVDATLIGAKDTYLSCITMQIFIESLLKYLLPIIRRPLWTSSDQEEKKNHMLLQINAFWGCCNTLDRRKEVLEFDKMRGRETKDIDQL